MWTASAEPAHISTAPTTTATPLIGRRRPNENAFGYQLERNALSENRDSGVLTNRATIFMVTHVPTIHIGPFTLPAPEFRPILDKGVYATLILDQSEV